MVSIVKIVSSSDALEVYSQILSWFKPRCSLSADDAVATNKLKVTVSLNTVNSANTTCVLTCGFIDLRGIWICNKLSTAVYYEYFGIMFFFKRFSDLAVFRSFSDVHGVVHLPWESP